MWVIRFSNNLISQASYPPEKVSALLQQEVPEMKERASFSSLEIKNYLKTELDLGSPCLHITLTTFLNVQTNWPKRLSLNR